MGSCCYANGYVYVFGGMDIDGCAISEAEKYNLSFNKPIFICNMPMCSMSNSSISINNSIFITGLYLQCIYKYSIEDDIYFSIWETFDDDEKFLCRGKSSFYLFEYGRLSESSDPSHNSLTLINSATGLFNVYLLSYSIRKESMIYFITSDGGLYSLNEINKNITLIRKVALFT